MMILRIIAAILLSPIILTIGLGVLLGDLICIIFHFVITGKVNDYEPFWKIMKL